jgi:hypothetical protein
LGSVVISRVRVLYPVPQSFEHAFHSEKAETAQSVGQAWSLHVTGSVSAPHASPP